MNTVLICRSGTLGAEIKDFFDILGTTTILDPMHIAAGAALRITLRSCPAYRGFSTT